MITRKTMHARYGRGIRRSIRLLANMLVLRVGLLAIVLLSGPLPLLTARANQAAKPPYSADQIRTVAAIVPDHVQTAVPRSAANTLTIGWAYDTPTLNPATGFNSTNSGIWVMVNIYDTLIRTGNDGTSLTPDLATSWDISNGGMIYTFHLRHGVTFHNGQKLTAADVKFCLDRARGPNQFWSWTLTAIKKVTVPDPSTVIITLLHPWAPFLSDLALFDTGVYPQAYFQKVGESYMSTHPIGTGPYMLDWWKPGQSLRLKKNPNYWMARQYPMQYVELEVIPDDTARLLKVKAGALDVGNALPPDQVATLKSNPSVKVVIDPSTEVEFFNFNMSLAPLNDVNVRQAINHAIDRAALIKTVLHGLGTPANSFIPKGAIDYNPNIPIPAHDYGLARRLLSKSSVAHGFTMTVEVQAGNSEWQATAQLFQRELVPLGIKVHVTLLSPGAQSNPRSPSTFIENLWTNDIPDPDEWVTTAISNNDPEDTALAHQAALTNDAATRKRIYYQLQENWARKVWFIALYYVPFVNVVNSHVQGFHQNPLGFFVLQDVHKS